MASSIPTRRVTRATRATSKDNENANARPSRIVTRTKASVGAASGATGPGLADGAQGKRKREALGEVTGKSINNRSKATDAKGKGKEAAPTKPTKTTTTATRQPLRQVATRTRNATVEQKKAAPAEDTMAVDHPAMPVPVVLLPAAPIHKSRTNRKTATTSTAVSAIPRLESFHKKSSSIKTEEELLEEEPVLKKRRTSSELSEEIPLEIIEEEELGAEPVEEINQELIHEVENEEWVEIERDDADDPQMVSEYAAEIFDYLKSLEHGAMPNPNYMDNQKELAWKMRGILIDWLIQVHSRFKLVPETLFLCVNLIDRFLSARVVSLAKLQLVGVSCMFIASKVEETIAPSVSNFIYCADSSYTEAEILLAEKYILKTVDWNLSYPCPYNFLRRISKADGYDVQIRTVGKYLIEIGCLEWRLLAAPPSLLAAAGMWLARLILDYPDWTPTHRHFSSYPEEALIPTANLMINYVLKPIAHESFYKKFASKRFLKVSVFVRDWALERWEERAQVNLAADLDQLKAEARQRSIENAALAVDDDCDL